MNIIPLLLVVALLAFVVMFFKLEFFRKYRVWFKVRWNFGMKVFKHLYYDFVYLVRITAFLKTLVIIGVGIGFILFLILTAIFFWNEYIVFLLRNYLKIEVNEIAFSISQGNFLRQFNIFWILGTVGGSLMSVFIKPKLEKFADKVNAKPYMIYIFGSNELTHRIINELVKLGLGPMTALIAEKKYYWIEELGKSVDVLILDSPEELRMPTLYDKIKFKNALKIISLVDNMEDNQHIILNVRRNNPEVEIIILSRNKPYMLDVVGERLGNISVIEDFETITREIIRRLALGFIYAPVIESHVPEEYIGKDPRLIEQDFNYKIRILKVKRGKEILMPEKLEKGDKILIYLQNEKVLSEFLQLIPLITPEEYEEEKEKTVIEETKEQEIEKEKGELNREDNSKESQESSILNKLKKD